MRIGIEAQRIFRKKRFGMDTVAIELINNLQKVDTYNEYFIFARNGENKSSIAKSNNFHFVEFDSISYIDWEQVKLPKIAKQYNIDVLHCTNNTAPLFCNIPIILTLHDTIFFEKLEIFKSNIPLYQSWGNFYRRLIVSKTIHKMQKVITVSNFERNLISNKFNLSESQIRCIYNGVGEEFETVYSETEKSEFLKQHSISKPFILFLGNLHPRKNMLGVLKAFGEWKSENSYNVRLLITNVSEAELVQFSKRNNIVINRSDLILPGYIERRKLPILYSEAEMLLYPSYREGFGIPILEGFASKLPVISSATSSMREVADDAAVLVEPTDYKEIKNAIHTIYSIRNLRENLIIKGLQRVKNFSWEKMAIEYHEQYLKILDNIKKH